MMTVHQVSALAGVSIRTLQYYDKIGLLPATAYTESGYRLYDTKALEQLQQILLFRELEFPLKDIRKILSSPSFDRQEALQQQITLLQLKKERMEALISLAREIALNGGCNMDFSAFDSCKLEAYAKQAKEAWGKTDAYREYAQKSQGRSPEVEAALGQGLMAIFSQLGAIKTQAPESDEAQNLVKQLQAYISQHYYRCTDQILSGLGQMYAAGGEFTENIDSAGGPGTAAFANAAIQAHCRK